MNRYDEWRNEREWRGTDRGSDRGSDRDERDERNRHSSFHPGNPGFDENMSSGRTAGDDDRQPYAQNPYGRYPGQAPRGGRDEWQSSRSERYGQREPYNGPRHAESRYSESQYGQSGQYGMGRGGRDQYAFERSRFDRGGAFGAGPFADTSDSPRYFGAGNYADGGASYGGGFDERQGQRNYGSLYGERDEQRNEQRYRDDRYNGPQQRYRAGPKGYTRSDDRLREDISERLMMADSIDSSEVSVTVKDAKVTLEGSVPNRRMKHAIEDLADNCPGVQDVDNRIRVRREEWGAGASSDSTAASNTMTASGVTPTSGSTGSSSGASGTSGSSSTTLGGRGRKE